MTGKRIDVDIIATPGTIPTSRIRYGQYVVPVGHSVVLTVEPVHAGCRVVNPLPFDHVLLKVTPPVTVRLIPVYIAVIPTSTNERLQTGNWLIRSKSSRRRTDHLSVRRTRLYRP
jgi:hypothetical protein